MRRAKTTLNLKGQKMKVQTTRLSTIIATSVLTITAASAVHAGDSSSVKDGWYLGLRTGYYIGPEVYSYKYEEPGFMEITGTFYGVAIGATYREWIPDSPDETLADNKMMIRGEGRLGFGNRLHYDGGLYFPATGVTIPYSNDGHEDFVFEGRLLLGPEWLSSNMLSTLYAGLGYRYLNDDYPSGLGSYERESNYYYLPIGCEISANLQAGWSWVGRIEFDYLLWGLQRSHVTPLLENRQNNGYGYRVSIRLQKESNDAMFVIEPFLRYWDIDDSEVEPGGYEPANNTTEVGISVIWMF